ncbi:FadR/GntR family transcriptional regulator [Pseudomonas sp. X10]
MDESQGKTQRVNMRLERLPVSHYAIEKIQERILSGEWPAGHQLPPQRDLAEQLEVSRNSLREAMSALESLGFLRVEAGKGTFVLNDEQRQAQLNDQWQPPGKFDLEEIYQMRFGLEGLAVMLLARSCSDKQQTELRRIVEHMHAAALSRDLHQLSQCHIDFHLRILRWSNNRMLEQAGENLRSAIERSNQWAFADQRFNSIVASIEEIEDIIEALVEHDPLKARMAVETHIMYSAERAGVVLGLPVDKVGA